MSLWGDIKMYRAVKRFRATVKGVVEMDTAQMKGKTKLGVILGALALLVPAILPSFGLAEAVEPIVAILGALAALFGGFGVADKLNRAKNGGQ